jgi:glycosyltransferase involved in cell wall biosynthesis
LLTYFFRKKRKSAFSIEELFEVILLNLPHNLQYKTCHLPEEGAKPQVIWKNGLFARKQQSEVNHITGEVHYLAFFLPKEKTILTIHDLRPLYRGNLLKRFILKQLWFYGPVKAAGYVTVISETTRKDLLKHIPGIEKKVHVIPNCLSPVFTFSLKAFNTELPRVLHLGTKENKNLERLIKALEGVRCHLRIIGPLNEKQEELLKEHEITYSCDANLNQEQIVAEYKSADIISFVSLQEGFGMPIIEAQATGRPVVTSNTSSMPEVAGEGALLVDPENVEDIKKAIIRLIEDEQLRRDLIEKGQKNIQRFQPKAVAAKYAELYRKIVA